MNCFELIKSVLDEAYHEIEGTEQGKDESITSKIESLQQDYSSLLTQNRQPIDYRDPITRFAYIYKYVTSHANLVFSIMDKSENRLLIRYLLKDQDNFHVSCIGGGPGSDFLGILKFIMRSDIDVKLRFQICDREKTWAESWSDVDEKIDSNLRVSTSYIPVDVMNQNDWEQHKKHYKADFFTMIYFFSELASNIDQAKPYFSSLLNAVKPGKTLLFIDNNNASFFEGFDQLILENNFEIISGNQETVCIPYEEDKSSLGEYFEKFGPPKIKANIAWRVAVKKSEDPALNDVLKTIEEAMKAT
jgi:SAM-dependent methyltransferase